MHHRLIRPLRQQRRNRIIPPIQYQQYRGRIRAPPKIKQLVLLPNLVPDLCGQLLRQRAILLIPDQRLLLETQQHREHAVGGPRERVRVPHVGARRPDPALRPAEAQREEVRVDDEVVGEVLLDHADYLVVVGFGETLERGLLDDVAKVYRQLSVSFNTKRGGGGGFRYRCGTPRTSDPGTRQ